MSLLPAPGLHGEQLRRGVEGLAAVGVIGGVVELATLHHWNSTVQLIPWVALGALGLLVVLVAVRPVGGTVRVVRAGGVAAVAAAAYGMWEHVASNVDTGYLDRDWGDRWGDLSTIARIWHSVNGDVGPSPLLAPGVIAQIGLCLLLATVGLPRATVHQPTVDEQRHDDVTTA